MVGESLKTRSSESKPVKTIFLDALEWPEGPERQSFLDRACDQDQALRQRVTALLDAHGSKDALLDSPAAEHIANDQALGVPDEVATDSVSLHFLEPSRRPDSLGRIAHYEMLEMVGKGGMGIVFRAFDEKLQRVIAIKFLAPQLAADEGSRQRFVREARAAAAVNHENVISIHAVEDATTVPFIVMEYIGGITLQERLEKGGPLELKEILRIGLQIAEGLAAAHRQGLVHRDIKPANILMENGIQRVKITDFGLARATDDTGLTRKGYIAGTPLYMSPEQAGNEEVDHRTDLFSLGSVFYALCTGQPPFPANSSIAVLKRVCEDTPAPIQKFNPLIPLWLQDIVNRLHRKKPGERFQTASEVADILSYYLSQIRSGLILKRLRSPMGQGFPQPKSLLRVVGGLGIAATFFALFWILQSKGFFGFNGKGNDPITSHTGNTQDWKPRPPVTLEELEKKPSALDSWKAGNLDPAIVAAYANQSTPVPSDLIGFLGENKWKLPNAVNAHWPSESPDGKTIALPCGVDVALYDAQSGALRRLLKGHTDRAFRGAFSPDGTLFACGASQGWVRVWNTETGKLVQTIESSQGDLWATIFDKKGQQVIAGGQDGSIKAWDVATGNEIRMVGKQESGVHSLCFTPDQSLLLSGGDDGKIRAWKWVTGDLVQTIDSPKDKITQLVFSPDGVLLASGGDSSVRLWKTKDFQPWKTLDTAGSGLLGFASDGKSLFAAPHSTPKDGERIVTQWDPHSGSKIVQMVLPGIPCAFAGHYSPLSNRFFTISCSPPDQRLGVFDSLTGKEIDPQVGHNSIVLTLASHPSGTMLASGSADHLVKLWTLPSDSSSPAKVTAINLEGHTREVWSLVFSPDGKILASGSLDGTIRLWSVPDGKLIREINGHSPEHNQLDFTPDGKLLAGGGEDGSIHLWEVETGQPVDQLPWHTGSIRSLAFSPDGKWVASGGTDKSIQVIEMETGRRRHFFRGPTLVTHLAFSPDSQTLASTFDSPGPSLRLWNIATKKEKSFFGHKSHVVGLSYHPAGTRIATGSFDAKVGLWKSTSEAHTPQWIDFQPFQTATSVSFLPEGRHLAVGLGNGNIAIVKVNPPG